VEADLATLIGNCQAAERFPQFRESWDSVFADAVALSGSVEKKAGNFRRRIALRVGDPESFCALFLAFADRETDLFLFNPSWSEAEYRRAEETVNPNWIIEGRKERSFVVVKGYGREDKAKLTHGGPRIMIPTGGTSGRIRFAIHDGGTLLASATAFLEHFKVDRVSLFCTLPLYHVSGFMQIIRAIAGEGEVVFGSLSDFEASHAMLGSSQGPSRFLSVVPTQLQRLLASGRSCIDLLKSYRAILVGGGPLSEELAALCRSLELPLAPTYGMTETASMVATLQPEAFLAGKSGQGFPLPHAEFTIEPDSQSSAFRRAEGRIKVKSSALFAGYYGQAGRAGDTFTTNDWGMLSSRGELTVLGRRDRVIISGGEKIDLEEVEKVLRDTGRVAEVIAFSIEDSDWGEALCLAYCPEDPNLDEAELRTAVTRSLSPHKRPKKWLRLETIPRNELGKVSVEVLRRLVEKS